MNKLILNNKEYTLNDELTAQLIETITKQDEVKSGRWVPSDQYYFLIDTVGSVIESFYSGDEEDEFRLSQGNVFEWREQAENHLTYLKALATIKEDAEWFVPDWSNRQQDKWCQWYSHNDKKFWPSSSAMGQECGAIYFESQEKLEASFKTHRAEWLCVFGISKEDK